jgi:raffinose/stachyose/melibiose transport system permease protein
MIATDRPLARTVATAAHRRRRWLGYLFITPALLLHLAIVGVPAVVTFLLSTVQWDGLRPPIFVGLGNFVEIVTRDDVFWRAFTNNLRWMAVFLTVPIVLGLLAAVLVGTVGRSQFLYRTIFFLPYIFAAAVVARMFGYLYHPFYGINLVFKQIGLPDLARPWLGDPNIAIYAVMFASLWHFWGFDFLVFLAALQQLDRALYEAAALDGATRWQSFRYVTLPLLRPTLVFVVLITTLWSFNAFEYVYIMTQGGPAHASQLMATWIYSSAVAGQRIGYASALAVLLTLLASGVIAAYIYLRRKGLEA